MKKFNKVICFMLLLTGCLSYSMISEAATYNGPSNAQTTGGIRFYDGDTSESSGPPTASTSSEESTGGVTKPIGGNSSGKTGLPNTGEKNTRFSILLGLVILIIGSLLYSKRWYKK